MHSQNLVIKALSNSAANDVSSDFEIYNSDSLFILTKLRDLQLNKGIGFELLRVFHKVCQFKEITNFKLHKWKRKSSTTKPSRRRQQSA